MKRCVALILSCLFFGGGFAPVALADHLPESQLVVTGWTSSNVLRYDEMTGAFVLQYDAGNAASLNLAHSVRPGPDGLLYVTSFGNNRVVRFDPEDGSFVDTFVTTGAGGLSGPTDALFGPDGNLYVSSINTSSVLRYDGATGAFLDVFVASGAGGLNGAEAMEFGPDGNLYVCSGTGNQVIRYDGMTGGSMGVFAGGRGFTVRRHGTQYDVEGGASLKLLDRVSLTGSYRLMGYELKQGTAELLDEVAGPFIGLMLRY